VPSHRQWTPLARSLVATGDRWTLLIVLALAPGASRVSQLVTRLPGISAGVLDDHLQQMVALGLASRRRFRELPPRVELELTDAGRDLVPIAAALTRWGMHHMWSLPRDRERIDVDALVSLLPVLLDDQEGMPDGVLEAVIASPERRSRHLFQCANGRLHVNSLPHANGEARPAVTAHVEGSENAWIAALGPAREHRELCFTGDEEFARRIFDALPRQPNGAPLLRPDGAPSRQPDSALTRQPDGAPLQSHGASPRQRPRGALPQQPDRTPSQQPNHSRATPTRPRDAPPRSIG
jgi:DNA-binding HxlR family transcriptional regulator